MNWCNKIRDYNRFNQPGLFFWTRNTKKKSFTPLSRGFFFLLGLLQSNPYYVKLLLKMLAIKWAPTHNIKLRQCNCDNISFTIHLVTSALNMRKKPSLLLCLIFSALGPIHSFYFLFYFTFQFPVVFNYTITPGFYCILTYF